MQLRQASSLPLLVGRTHEIESLDQALHAVHNGMGRCILLAGAAGIGKSRLVREFLRRTAADRSSVLRGYCVEQDTSFPYALWINALRTFFAWSTAEEIRQSVGTLTPEFVKLLPELTLILPEIASTPAVRLDAESEKRRLFEALARFAAMLSQDHPLVISLEDLQWSDEASLEFLRLFIPRIAEHPVLLIATYRDDELSPQLSHLLAYVNRERAAEKIVLGPLNSAEVSELTRSLLGDGGSVDDELMGLVVQLTEGNPFYIEELVRSLVESGELELVAGQWRRRGVSQVPIPSSVRNTVQKRAERLNPDTRQALVLAAVAGQHFGFGLLQDISGRDEHTLLSVLKELIAAQFLIEESLDQFAFRHALTREAIYSGLLYHERRTIHRQIGEAIERYGGTVAPTHVADLAFQFYRAGEWRKALDYSQRAGEIAAALHAPSEALAHFTRALEVAEKLGIPPTPATLRARAHALELLGQFEIARADYERAVATAQSAGDRREEWADLIDLGFLWQSRDWNHAGECFKQALDLANALGEPDRIATTLNRIGNWHMNRGRAPEALSDHRQALALFEEKGNRQETAHTLELLGIVSYNVGDAIKGAAYCEQAVPILRELRDSEGLVNTLTNLSLRARFDTEVLGDIEFIHLARLSEEAFEIAHNSDWRQGEAEALNKAAIALGRAGEFGLALDSLERARTIALEIQHRQSLADISLTLGESYLAMLAFDQARREFESGLALAQDLGSVLLVSVLRARLASACIQMGEFQRAKQLLDALIDSSDPTEDMSILQRFGWAARAELELALGNPERAVDILERLLASTANLVVFGGLGAVPHLAHLHAKALMMIRKKSEAAVELESAIQTARHQRQQALLWNLQAELARIYLALGRRGEAKRELASAQAVVEELATKIPNQNMRTKFLRETTARFPGMRPPRTAKHEYLSLTERELQVASLIAQGKTNREISAALTVTVRTTESHITRIMDKLGFTSRAQIAVWAAAHGLGAAEKATGVS